jgi:rubrerythrin
VYDAQSALEEVHKQEEDELYKQMFQDRKRHVDKLERHLTEEKRRTVKELIAWFDKREATKEEKQLGIKKVCLCINIYILS